ncbi:MAG: D-alanine--D-alanine ligase [Chloroflexi bacterium]|nr:D-alanine--D-alanine ligase [Chloroflexota bacterium]
MKSNKIRVAVIFGGRSGEHEVSVVSAESIMKAIDRSKYDVVPIGITKEGKWLMSGDPLAELRGAAPSSNGASALLMDPTQRRLVAAHPSATGDGNGIDVVIPIMHGTYGEDGTIQGLLEMINVPYVGAGVLASAVGMDKSLMKMVFAQNGIPVVDWITVMAADWRAHSEAVRRRVDKEIGFPCFVKPACLGSSVGISKVKAASELEAAIREAAQYDRKIVIEKGLENFREIECSVLGNDAPRASIPGEVIPCNEFYDYRAKYVDEGSQLIIPANLPVEAVQEVQRLAIASFAAIDCSGMARVDFFVSRDGRQVFVNEINTIPGFTSISMYPKLWEASGISYSELIDRLIQLAIQRHEEKNGLRTSYQI